MLKIKKQKLIGIISFWLVLIITFGGSYKTPIGNISVFHINLAWGLFLILLSINVKKTQEKPNLSLYYFYLLLISLLLIPSILNYSLYNIGDYSFIDLQFKRVIQILISFFLFPFIVIYAIKNLNQKEIFFTLLSFIIFIFILSTIQLTNENFKIWYINQTAIDGYWYEWAQTSNRAIGLKAISIWDTSISYSLLTFIGFSIYFYNRKEISSYWFYLFFSLIFLLVIISGRTGLLLLMLFMTFLSIRYKKYGFLILFITFISMTSSILIYLLSSDMLTRITSFAFELFLNLGSGNIETNSTNDLLENHLFLPTINNIFFGDNIFIGDGDEVISKIGRSSDSAFVINYVAYGVFGLIVTSLLSIINALIFFDYFQLYKKNIFYLGLLILCILISFALYTKILVYVSPTLIKSMVLVKILIFFITKISMEKKNEE
ncbi:hypothetical protein ACI8BE_017880 [Proteus mirabilis]|uniref:hypothetical protein n=1 Tax=Proteus mirabilis TaxID=584 RepID=UPI0018C8554D|nr:hypothetical protein [Proteus mirabilis]MBG6001328.1 hypothetical protein [Proteus mirabilis]